jgi:hypothetical protein
MGLCADMERQANDDIGRSSLSGGTIMNGTFSRASIAGLALGLIAGLGLLSPHLAARDLPHSTLMAADGSGVPAGFTSQQWLSAEGEARVVTQEDGHDVIEFEASGLVPEGLYTFWWVSRGILGTSMGPGGGTPDNEFTADGDGNATATIRVSSDNDYQTMIVAYHADGQTHADSPGQMGTESFQHLMGPWPGPAGETAN